MPKAQQARLLRKRCFVQMTGYEPVGAERQHHRFIREMARFQKAWNVQGEVAPAVVSADGAVASWSIACFGPNWRVATEFHWFRWDDFVRADLAESDWWRFPLGIAALSEYALASMEDDSIIAAHDRRVDSDGAQRSARALDLLDGGLGADVGSEHDEREVVDETGQPRDPVVGDVA